MPDTFVSHIRLSVPLYDEGHDLICHLSDFFVSNNDGAKRSAAAPCRIEGQPYGFAHELWIHARSVGTASIVAQPGLKPRVFQNSRATSTLFRRDRAIGW